MLSRAGCGPRPHSEGRASCWTHRAVPGGSPLTVAVLDVDGGLCLQQQRDEVQAATQGCVVQRREPATQGRAQPSPGPRGAVSTAPACTGTRAEGWDGHCMFMATSLLIARSQCLSFPIAKQRGIPPCCPCPRAQRGMQGPYAPRETPARGIPHPPCPVRGPSRWDRESCISPLRGTAGQPAAALLTASGKCTGPVATPGPSARRSLPMPAGMPGAHSTVWEAASNERALCLGAVKGACLPSAPPVLSREG